MTTPLGRIRRRVPRRARRRFAPTALALGAVLALTASGALGAGEIAVTGRILDGGGQTVTEAEVELLPLLNPQDRARLLLAGGPLPAAVDTAKSDREGRFRVTAPRPGMWRIRVRHAGHLPWTHHLRPLLDDATVPELRLPESSRRSFKVVDERDQPVAGLHLAAWSMPAESPEGWIPETSYLETAADGTVLVDGHPGSRVVLAAAHGDRFLFEILPWPDEDTVLRLTEKMQPVRLVDAGGHPAAGVYGCLEFPFLPLGISGDNGEIVLPSRPKRGVRLAFVDGEGQYPDGAAVEKRDAETVLRLPAVTVLDGRVVAGAEETPVADALVWNEGVHLRSDRGGSFRLRVAEQAWFQAAAPGFLTATVRRSAADGGEQTVVLEPAIEARGRVFDADGEAVARAEVRASPGMRVEYLPDGSYRRSTMDMEPRTAISDDQGRFALRRLAPDVTYRIEARRPGYAPAEAELPAIAAGTEPEELLLTLAAGLRAFGTVLDAERQPIAGAEVRLIPASRREDPYRRFPRDVRSGPEATTGVGGRFDLRDLGEGVFTLQVSASGYSQSTLPGIEIRAESGVTDLGTVILDPARPLRGRVTDREGRPVKGASVMAMAASPMGGSPERPAQTETGADGAFQLDGVGRRMSIHVSHRGFQSVSLHDVVPDPEKPLHVVLEPGVSLAGQVVDEEGRPVAQASVTVGRKLMDGSSSMTMGTDPEGRFELPAQAPGTVTISAHSDQGIADPLELELAADSGRREVRLVLRPAAVLSGRVIDAYGAAVAKALVFVEPLKRGALEPRDSAESRHEGTDAAGRFTVAGLHGGAYRVLVSHSEYEPVTEVIEVTAGDHREVELVVGERRVRPRITGQVIGADGGAVGGATIRLLDGAHQVVGETASTASGAFEISAPQPGEFSLLVDHADFAFYRGETLRLEGPLDGVVVELDHGGMVTGEIHGLEADDLTRVTVSLTGPTLVARHAVVTRDGRYRITGIPAGEWTLQAGVRHGVTVNQTIRMGPPGDVVELDLSFAEGYRLSGVVLLDGAPLAGAQVAVRCAERGAYAYDDTGSAGRFELDGIPAGSCELTLTYSEKALRTERRLEITGDRDVVLELRPVPVSGQVLSAADLTPLADVVVEVFRDADMLRIGMPMLTARTGADGRFTLPGIEAGVWQLRARRPGYSRALDRLEVGDAGAAEVRLLMIPAVPAEVIVLNADGTVPRRVAVRVSGSSGPERHFDFQPDAEGRIVLDVLPAGTWSLEVYGDRGRAELELQIPGPPVRVELSAP